MQHFETAYRSCYPRVLAYLRRRTDDSVAEDLCADVFARAWSGWPPRGADAMPWFYGIARNVVLEHYRRRRESVPLDEVAESAWAARSAEMCAAAEVDISQALRALNETDREIITLYAWENLRPAEIAAVLGIKENAARVRLHRARTRLADLLNETTGVTR
ncbi:RNA polymerase sigma factor [Corynebacterium qintianiae]|uniref:RNA polymerase sigma factor n=1 Tax=Corynebacterium qintianiae TaxID=2709392 RepID=UPI0013EC9D1F|nr:sigma-70 family RNA polymerase sigma factor [Corynebacterium qintianiae]